MAKKLGYDKDGNLVVFDDKGNIVGRIYDSCTEQIAANAKKEKEKETKFTSFGKK